MGVDRRTALRVGIPGFSVLIASACNDGREIEEWSKTEEILAFQNNLRRQLRRGSIVEILDGHLVVPAGVSSFQALDHDLNPIYPRARRKETTVHTPVIISGWTGHERLAFAEGQTGRLSVITLDSADAAAIRQENSSEPLSAIPRDRVRVVSSWRYDHSLRAYGAYHEGKKNERGRSYRVRFAYAD